MFYECAHDYMSLKLILFIVCVAVDVLILYSGYDFGYFVKLLTAESLPTTEDKFFAILRIWFPTVYDLKFLMRATKVLKGGLQEVADDLGVRLSCITIVYVA